MAHTDESRTWRTWLWKVPLEAATLWVAVEPAFDGAPVYFLIFWAPFVYLLRGLLFGHVSNPYDEIRAGMPFRR